MATHELRTWPDYFVAVAELRKRFEWRRDDRVPEFAVGDILHLREWEPDRSSPAPEEVGRYTGRSLSCRVTFVLRGPAFGLPEDYAVMSLGAPTLFDPGSFPKGGG